MLSYIYDNMNIKALSQEAFEFVKKARELLNLSQVERVCGIRRTSLINAVNRKQNKFKYSDKLIPVLDKHLPGWRKSKTNANAKTKSDPELHTGQREEQKPDSE